MNDDFQAKFRRYAEDMPLEWALRWNEASTQSHEVLTLVEDVVCAVEHSTLTYQQAGFILRPLIVHPVAEARLDGELTALGLHADSLTAGPQLMSRTEAEYEWSEVMQCLQRIRSTQLPA